MIRQIVLLSLLIGLAGCSHSAASDADQPIPLKHPVSTAASPKPISDTLDVYFVRHVETVANATGKYNAQTIDAISATGQKELTELKKDFSSITLTAAVSSPSPRALTTAAAILSTQHIQATVWPELDECCLQTGAARLKPMSPKVKYGAKVSIPAVDTKYFTLKPSGLFLWDVPTYQDGIRQVKAAVQNFQSTFQPLGGRVLVVSHAGCGSRFLEGLLAMPMDGAIMLKNGCLVHLQSVHHGPFKVISQQGTSLKVSPVTSR